MIQNLSGIRSEALIGRWSSFTVLAFVCKWQTKDKRLQRSNVNAMNLQQNSQYLWNRVFSRSSIWFLLERIRRWPQHFTKIDQEKRKIEVKFAFGTPWLPDLLWKHWFKSSVWNFCRWVEDIPHRETSLSINERGEASAVRRLLFSSKQCIIKQLLDSVLWYPK